MTNNKFTPERGQFFWFIKETIIDGFPDLEIESAKFDPKNKEHKSHSKNGNCYVTKEEAFESLM